jgi:hyperosmotically inducible protein
MSYINSTAAPAGWLGARLRRGISLFLAVALIAAVSTACASRSVRPATDDSALTTRVRTALLNDPQVAAAGISVASSAGVITLSGSVRTAVERDRAVAVARQTSGVSDVRSELAVTQP